MSLVQILKDQEKVWESENRKVETVYKNIIIHSYKGSNFAYVGKRIFNSTLSAKRHITKVLNHFDNDKEKAWRYYTDQL